MIRDRNFHDSEHHHFNLLGVFAGETSRGRTDEGGNVQLPFSPHL